MLETTPVSLPSIRRSGWLIALVIVTAVIFASPSDAADSAVTIDGTWLPLHFSARFGHAAVYDPLRDRIIVVGGQGTDLSNDVFAVTLSDPPKWIPVVTSGNAPPVRAGQSLVYDAAQDRLLLYGGQDASFTFLKDVWALSLSGNPTWTSLGSAPVARAGHLAIYDPVRNRMVVYGGQTTSIHPGPECRNDLAWLDLGTMTWTTVTTGQGPAAVCYPVGGYDSLHDRMVVYDPNARTVWQFNFASTWFQTTVSGGPSSRTNTTAIFDPVRSRLMLFGGQGSSVDLGDAWALSLSGTPAWSSVTLSGDAPGPRHQSASVYDPVRDRWIVIGGASTHYLADSVNTVTENQNDARSLPLADGSTWSVLALPGAPPAAGSDAVFYDSPHDRMVLVANAGYETQQNEVWAFAHSGATPSTWSRLDAGGPSPSRWGAAVVLDPPRNRILLFGGGTNTGGPQPYFNDVWAFPLTGGGGWTLVSTVGTRPLPRAYAIAAYDAGRDRIVLCGGRDDAGQFYEVWELSLAGSPTWNDITPAGAFPSVTTWETALYDATRDRLLALVFTDQRHAEVWGLPFTGPHVWSQLGSSSTLPTTNSRSLILDPVRDRLVSVGNAGTYYVLPLGGPASWTQFITQSSSWGNYAPKYGSPAAYDPLRDRLWIRSFNQNQGTVSERTFGLYWGQTLGVPSAATESRHAIELSALFPNPARSSSEIAFQLGAGGITSVSVLDVSGRRVADVRNRAWLPAGAYRLRWDGHDQSGRAAAPGLYFVSVECGTVRAARRLVVVP